MSSAASSKAKGLYKQSKTPEEYLNQRLDKTQSCWIFTSGKDKDGYGQCHAARVSKENKVTRAHQLAFIAWKGPIRKGYVVCHTCDNPSCCNPDHLFLGTIADNNKDCREKGRNKPGGRGKNKHYDEIVSLHGVLTCKQVAEKFNITFSNVCYIWRKEGLYGRRHY